MQTVIDLADFELIKDYHYKWFAYYNKSNQTFYVRANEYLGKVNGKDTYRTEFLHKLLIKADYNEWYVVDHIDNDPLNNRRANLRVVKQNENLLNRKSKNSNNTSGYRNVHWNSKKGCWMIQLQINGKNKRFGYYDNPHEAGRKAEELREQYYKDFKGVS